MKYSFQNSPISTTPKDFYTRYNNFDYLCGPNPSSMERAISSGRLSVVKETDARHSSFFFYNPLYILFSTETTIQLNPQQFYIPRALCVLVNTFKLFWFVGFKEPIRTMIAVCDKKRFILLRVMFFFSKTL